MNKVHLYLSCTVTKSGRGEKLNGAYHYAKCERSQWKKSLSKKK